MVRLRVLSGREVCRILEQHGFTEVRRRGSHVVTQRRTSEGTITVPIPDHAELAIGTLLSIIRQSRVARRHSNHRSDPCAGQDRRSSSLEELRLGRH